METDEQTLLTDIIRFCGRTGMTPTDFGERAVNNRALVTRLRQGTSPQLRTVRKVYEFMEANGGR